MSEFVRSAKVVWEGDLAGGSGTIESGSGALGDLPVNWSARVESSNGRTSPEELIAAAHATCYAMAFSHTLAGAGHKPEQLEVSAVVKAELEDGLHVRASELTVTGRVPGLDQSQFESYAREAEQSCPVSNALRGGIEIRVNAALAD